jgi:BirA family transcriptional regulator, biotin operon repressor / biotin---[acetyl-CoA-carboxylase] ligase
MTVNEIKLGLKTNILGKEIVYFDETTSTNDVAFDLALGDAIDGTLVIADSQTKGKGRLDRKWFSPKGTSILASLILRPNMPLSHSGNIIMITTISIVQAIRHITNLNAMIKWPNDVIVNDRKVSGILVESKIERNSAKFFVVGFGVNVNVPKDGFPEEILETATSLSIESKHEVSRIQLLQEILYQLELRYTKLTNDSTDFLQEWKSLSMTIGQRVKIERPNEIFFAGALDIDKNGALIIQLDSGEIQSIMNDDLVKIRY